MVCLFEGGGCGGRRELVRYQGERTALKCMLGEIGIGFSGKVRSLRDLMTGYELSMTDACPMGNCR